MGPQSIVHYQRHHRLFSKVKRVEIDLTIRREDAPTLNVGRCALALLAFLRQTAPGVSDLSQDSVELLDLRGRPRETFKTPPRAISDERVRREEIFAAAGLFCDSPNESVAPTEINDGDRWNLEILSQFDSFRGTQHIIHRANQSLSGFSADITERFVPANLGYLFPVIVTECRLGLEFYRSRFRGSMLSFAPGIESRIYVDISPAGMTLHFADEFIEQGVPLRLTDPEDLTGKLLLELTRYTLGSTAVVDQLRELDALDGRAVNKTEALRPRAR